MRLARIVGVVVVIMMVMGAALAVLVWRADPSAGAGQLKLPPKNSYTRGQFFTYAAPWGGELSRWTRSWSDVADAIIVDRKRFPANTKVSWRWPPFAPRNGAGVWGYDYVAHGNYDAGPTEQAVPPVMVHDLKVFRQAFRWQMAKHFGNADVLTEFYLRGSATDVESRRLEVGWLLHTPANIRRFFEASRLVGTYIDPVGRRWTVRLNEKYCMFAPVVAGDVTAGQIDMLDALRWLQQKGLVKGDWWLWGVAIGAEPVSGLGQLTLQQWAVQRR